VANEETFSFQEALNELHLEEEELKKLVSEGEIRAFREGEDMRLRREDVETLRSELGGDIAFEDDDFADAGMATEEISAADTLIDDIEDVGEIEDIDEIEDLDEEEYDDDDDVPVATAIAVDEPFEGMGTRIAMIATSVVLFMALPLFMAMATGQLGGIARGIAGMFVPELKE
jgi:excisionase family DNA binding protein